MPDTPWTVLNQMMTAPKTIHKFEGEGPDSRKLPQNKKAVTRRRIIPVWSRSLALTDRQPFLPATANHKYLVVQSIGDLRNSRCIWTF